MLGLAWLNSHYTTKDHAKSKPLPENPDRRRMSDQVTQPSELPSRGRYVILLHDAPVIHWDLMLEQPETLRTWRLLSCPEPSAVLEAEAIADHRLRYLDYEGPVSGDRGTVAQWDSGEYSILRQDRAGIEMRLTGVRCSGSARFEHQRENLWRFVCPPEVRSSVG